MFSRQNPSPATDDKAAVTASKKNKDLNLGNLIIFLFQRSRENWNKNMQL